MMKKKKATHETLLGRRAAEKQWKTLLGSLEETHRPPVWGRLLMVIVSNLHSPARGRSPLPKLAPTHLTTGWQRTRVTRYPTRLFLGLRIQQRQLGMSFLMQGPSM